MRDLLTKEGSTSWRGGDNDFWGEYLVTRLPDDGAKVRIFVEKARFVIDVSAVREPVEFARAMDFVQRKVLPLLGAYEMTTHPGWE